MGFKQTRRKIVNRLIDSYGPGAFQAVAPKSLLPYERAAVQGYKNHINSFMDAQQDLFTAPFRKRKSSSSNGRPSKRSKPMPSRKGKGSSYEYNARTEKTYKVGKSRRRHRKKLSWKKKVNKAIAKIPNALSHTITKKVSYQGYAGDSSGITSAAIPDVLAGKSAFWTMRAWTSADLNDALRGVFIDSATSSVFANVGTAMSTLNNVKHKLDCYAQCVVKNASTQPVEVDIYCCEFKKDEPSSTPVIEFRDSYRGTTRNAADPDWESPLVFPSDAQPLLNKKLLMIKHAKGKLQAGDELVMSTVKKFKNYDPDSATTDSITTRFFMIRYMGSWSCITTASDATKLTTAKASICAMLKQKYVYHYTGDVANTTVRIAQNPISGAINTELYGPNVVDLTEP